jgi:uncharacterized protein (TIGR00251 family)
VRLTAHDEEVGVAVSFEEGDGGVTFSVYVTPRAGRSEVAGERGGAVWLRLAAPPVEGKANDALVELLARLLGVSRRDVALVSGATGRHKRVHVAGVVAAQARRRLLGAAAHTRPIGTA